MTLTFQKEKDPLCLVLAHFKDICLPSFYIRLFVLSSTCLTVRTKRIVELMNVLCCYYLLACACMNLLFLCLGWGGRGTETWFKKKKITVYHVTYVTVDCNSLPELIKI